MSYSMQPKTPSLVASAKRIVIVGSTGCGKRALGKKLANLLNKNFVCLDNLDYLPNRKLRPHNEFLEKTGQALSNDEWVASAAYPYSQNYLWQVTDMIIWVDLPLLSCLWGTFKKKLRDLLFHSNDVNPQLIWVWDMHVPRQEYFEKRLSPLKNTGYVVRLRSHREIELFMNEISNYVSAKSKNQAGEFELEKA